MQTASRLTHFELVERLGRMDHTVGDWAVMVQTVGWKHRLWLILFVALILRLGLAFGVQQRVSRTPGRLCLIAGDAEGYWHLAGKLAAFDDYSIYDPPRYLLRMPGFPLLLALPRLVFGNHPFAARILLAFVGTLACGLTYWLGRELAGDTAGAIAAAYTAISPTMALFSVLFLSETAFAAALLASLIAAARLVRTAAHSIAPGSRGPIRLAGLTGVLIGIATYMRPTWLLVGPGIAALLVVFGRGPIRSRWISAGTVCVGLAITLAPWTIRNAYLTGHFIPTTLWVGPSLYDGLNPLATGDSDMEFFEKDDFLQTMSEYEMDRKYRQLAWAFAADNPGRVIWLALVKQSRYWNPAPNGSQFDNWWIRLIAWLFYLPLIAFALIGTRFARRDIWLLTLTVAPILYFAALHLLFVGSLRYRLPAEYPLAVLSAVGLCRCFSSGRALP